MKDGYYTDQKQWLADWKRQKNESRLQLVAAMRLWRAAHPQYIDAKVVSHGWFGHVVMASVNHERVVVAQVADVIKNFEAQS